MKCLRCGHCCKTMFSIVPDDPKKGLAYENLIANDDGTPCKHLKGDKIGEFSCAVHDEPWYEDTPCAEFGQIEKDPNTLCRLGVREHEKAAKELA